jgi:hypothetical protein
MSEPNWTACDECNRGGNGNDKDKCACGWQITEPNGLGCYIGSEIVGQIRPKKKLTKSQNNYRRYLDSDPGCSFAEWMGFGRFRFGPEFSDDPEEEKG